MQRIAITVLARAPVPGQAKTRLARDVGDEVAAAIHEAFTLDLLESLSGLAGGGLVLALCGPGDECARFAATATAASQGLRTEDQGEGDLGDRMGRAMDLRLAEGAEAALVLGADCLEIVPCLPAVAAALRQAGVVLVPAGDGGFVLLGASRSLPPGALAGLPWGTEFALRATCRALEDHGLAPCVLEPKVEDVDDLPGLLRLAGRLARPGSPAAPRVRSLLSSWILRSGGSATNPWAAPG